jgi:hypothetical protein
VERLAFPQSRLLFFFLPLLGEGCAFPQTSSYLARPDRVGPKRRKAELTERQAFPQVRAAEPHSTDHKNAETRVLT